MRHIESSQLIASTSGTASQQSRFTLRQISIILLGMILSATLLSLCLPASVEVTPVVDSIVTTDPSRVSAQKMSAIVYNWAGHILRWPKLEWSSDAPSVATVDHNGIVKITGPGMVDITARTFGGHRGNASLQVFCLLDCDLTRTLPYQEGHLSWVPLR
jgi:hypothetical protein